jgi:hypothetical protein
MDLGEVNPCFAVPHHPVVRNDDALAACKLKSPACSKLWDRIEALNKSGLSGVMVATEFLSARIAPLQKHRHGLQDFDLHSNMSLGRGPLEDDMVGIELNHLIHTGIPVDPLEDVLPLYHDPQKASILEELPEFGGKGLLNSAPMDESLDSELPEALAPSAIVAAHQGAEVEGDGESSHAIEEEEDPKTHPVKTGPSSIAVAVEGPRPAAEGRTPLSTGWVSEAFDEDE